MSKFNNTMDVFKLLPKTNCRKCNKPTCLAFAAAVFKGQISALTKMAKFSPTFMSIDGLPRLC